MLKQEVAVYRQANLTLQRNVDELQVLFQSEFFLTSTIVVNSDFQLNYIEIQNYI